MTAAPTTPTRPDSGGSSELLSVVVVGGNERERLASCLGTVFAQQGCGSLDVVVVDCTQRPDDLAERFPQARWIRPRAPLHYGDALAIGARLTRAPVVAFLEEHARARPGWARALVDALAPGTPWTAAACEVHSGNPGVGRSDGWGLMGYGMWYAPLGTGETEFLHGYNSACRREVLLSYGDQLGELLLADSAFAARLRQDGHRLINAPDARIEHLNETELVLPLRKTLLAHRFSAPTRADACAWPRWKRLAYALGSPLLPAWGLWCSLRRYRGRPEMGILLRNVPQFVVAHTAMALGTSIGLLFGPGRAAYDFTLLELENQRPEAGAG